MYYNGYIIICIFIGAYLGSFIFHWEPLAIGYVVATTSIDWRANNHRFAEANRPARLRKLPSAAGEGLRQSRQCVI